MKTLFITLISLLLITNTVSAISVNLVCGDGICGQKFELFQDDLLELNSGNATHYLRIYSVTETTALLQPGVEANTTLTTVLEGQIKKINGTEYYMEYITPSSGKDVASVKFILTDEYTTCSADCGNKTTRLKCNDGSCNNEIIINEGDTVEVMEDGRHMVTVENVSDSVELRIDGRTRTVVEGDLIAVNNLDFRLLQIDSEQKTARIIFGDENINTCPVDCLAKSCTETDGGKNYYVRSVVSSNTEYNVEDDVVYHDTMQSYPDECLPGPQDVSYYLKEWWCDNNTARNTIFTCTIDCIEGACYTNETVCIGSECITNETISCGDGICDEGELCPVDCDLGCAMEGENYSTYFADYPERCCSGLTEWASGTDIREVKGDWCLDSGKVADLDIGICLNCGNGVCEDIENLCNCPEDCEPVLEESDVPVVDITNLDINQMSLDVVTALEGVKPNLKINNRAKLAGIQLNIIATARSYDGYEKDMKSRGILYWLMWLFGQQETQEKKDVDIMRNTVTVFADSKTKLIYLYDMIEDENSKSVMEQQVNKLGDKIVEITNDADAKAASAAGMFS